MHWLPLLQTVVRPARVGATPALLHDTPWLSGCTVTPPWTQLMPVCYGVAQWSYGGDMVYAGRATVMPRTKPVLFRTPEFWWSPVVLIFCTPLGPLPVERRLNTVMCKGQCKQGFTNMSGVSWATGYNILRWTRVYKGSVWTRLY